MDRRKSENDYKVNLKNEIIIEDLHYKLDEMLKKQEEISDRVSSLEGNPEPMRKRSEKKYKFIDIVDKQFFIWIEILKIRKKKMNIFEIEKIPETEEILEILAQGDNVRIERILSNGQTTDWMIQDEKEFV